MLYPCTLSQNALLLYIMMCIWHDSDNNVIHRMKNLPRMLSNSKLLRGNSNRWTFTGLDDKRLTSLYLTANLEIESRAILCPLLLLLAYLTQRTRLTVILPPTKRQNKNDPTTDMATWDLGRLLAVSTLTSVSVGKPQQKSKTLVAICSGKDTLLDCSRII